MRRRFPGAQMCQIAELHVDYFEKFTLDSGELDEFVCPIQMTLPAAEQLSILQEKNMRFFAHDTGAGVAALVAPS